MAHMLKMSEDAQTGRTFSYQDTELVTVMRLYVTVMMMDVTGWAAQTTVSVGSFLCAGRRLIQETKKEETSRGGR